LTLGCWFNTAHCPHSVIPSPSPNPENGVRRENILLYKDKKYSKRVEMNGAVQLLFLGEEIVTGLTKNVAE
jgi:hypothetical protein